MTQRFITTEDNLHSLFSDIVDVPVTTLTANTTIANFDDRHFIMLTTAGNRTISLPAEASAPSNETFHRFQFINFGSNLLTLNLASGETFIHGSSLLRNKARRNCRDKLY